MSKLEWEEITPEKAENRYLELEAEGFVQYLKGGWFNINTGEYDKPKKKELKGLKKYQKVRLLEELLLAAYYTGVYDLTPCPENIQKIKSLAKDKTKFHKYNEIMENSYVEYARKMFGVQNEI